MFDLHYHLLYGVDDGPKSIEDSLAMAEASIAEGTTHIVCTPHLNHTYQFRPEANQQALDRIRERLDGRLTLATGCEFHLTDDHMALLCQDPGRYTLNQGRYLLVELSEFSLPPHIEDWFDDIHALGLTPIVAHPERNPLLLRQLDRISDWVLSGVLLQLTGASLAGRFGKRAEEFSKELLDRGLVHLVASDAHAVKMRGPSMRRAYEFLAARYGAQTAERLCSGNPKAIFFGETLLPVAAVGGKAEARKRSNLLSRLLRSGFAHS